MSYRLIGNRVLPFFVVLGMGVLFWRQSYFTPSAFVPQLQHSLSPRARYIRPPTPIARLQSGGASRATSFGKKAIILEGTTTTTRKLKTS